MSAPIAFLDWVRTGTGVLPLTLPLESIGTRPTGGHFSHSALRGTLEDIHQVRPIRAQSGSHCQFALVINQPLRRIAYSTNQDQPLSCVRGMTWNGPRNLNRMSGLLSWGCRYTLVAMGRVSRELLHQMHIIQIQQGIGLVSEMTPPSLAL
jgi:Protein of unknown function (DUF3405).